MRTALVTVVVAVGLIVAAFVTGYAGVYDALNSGVYVGRVGFEFVGPDGPGFFVCDDASCGSDL